MKQRHFWLASVLLSLFLLFALFTVSSSASNTYNYDIDGHGVYTYYRESGTTNWIPYKDKIILNESLPVFEIMVEIYLSTPIQYNKVFDFDLGLNMQDIGSNGFVTDTNFSFFASDGSNASSTTYTPILEDGSAIVKNATADIAAVSKVVFTTKLSYVPWTDEALPEFYIDYETYNFDEGMTLEEWVNSDYNTGGYICTNGQVQKWVSLDSYYYVMSVTGSNIIHDKQKYTLAYYEPEPPTPTTYYCNYGGYYFLDATAFKQLAIALLDNGHTDLNCFEFNFFDSGLSKNYLSLSAQSSGVKYSVKFWTSNNFYNALSWNSITSNNYKYMYPSTKQEIPEWFYNWLNTYCTWHETENYPSAASNYDSGLVNLSATYAASSAVRYSFTFYPTSITYSDASEEDIQGGIFNFIKKIWQGITNLPQNIASSIKGFFTELGNKISALGSFLLEGIKNLFVPSADDITEVKAKFETLLSERFGAVYDSSEIIDDFASVFTTNGVSATSENTISFPSVTVNLAGSDFTFGGWDVDIIPDGFEVIVTTLKLITSVVCTFLFVNGLRKRLDAILK